MWGCISEAQVRVLWNIDSILRLNLSFMSNVRKYNLRAHSIFRNKNIFLKILFVFVCLFFCFFSFSIGIRESKNKSESKRNFRIFIHDKYIPEYIPYGGPQLSRQNKIQNKKIKFRTTNWNYFRQTTNIHGKNKNSRHYSEFLTAKANRSRQKQIAHDRSRPGRLYVGRWNERVRAKRCDAVDWGLLKQGDSTYLHSNLDFEKNYTKLPSMWIRNFFTAFLFCGNGKR